MRKNRPEKRTPTTAKKRITIKVLNIGLFYPAVTLGNLDEAYKKMVVFDRGGSNYRVMY